MERKPTHRVSRSSSCRDRQQPGSGKSPAVPWGHGVRSLLWTTPAERTGRLFVLLCVGNTALLCGCRLWRLGKQLSTQLATSEKKKQTNRDKPRFCCKSGNEEEERLILAGRAQGTAPAVGGTPHLRQPGASRQHPAAAPEEALAMTTGKG